jgi:hypothetical protein
VVLDPELDAFQFASVAREYPKGRPGYGVNDTHALAAERGLEVYLYNQKAVQISESTVEQHNLLCQYATLYWASHYQSLDREQLKNALKAKAKMFFF